MFRVCVVTSCVGRRLRPCTCAYSSLVSTHKAFLDAVKAHGEGSVQLTVGPDQIAELCISNAVRKNAMSGKMLFELASAVDRLLNEETDRVSCVIVRSRGDSNVFCSGLDLNLAKEVVNTPEMGVKMSRMMTDTLNSLRNSSVLSVALLEGPAIGGGAELSTTCDFRIMGSSSYCQFVHGKLGVSPGWGGLNRLVSLVGRTTALKLLCSSRRMSPEEALRCQYADDVIPESENPDTFVRNFLIPYWTHPFPDALKNLKRAVVQATAVTESCNQRGMLEEIFAFQRRWGGADNKQALQQKKK